MHVRDNRLIPSRRETVCKNYINCVNELHMQNPRFPEHICARGVGPNALSSFFDANRLNYIDIGARLVDV